MDSTFARKKHIHFFTRILQILPNRYSMLDTSRLTVTFFALSGLDILGALDTLTDTNKQEIIDWIYSLQVIPNRSKSNLGKCGFRGSTSNGVTTQQYVKVTDSANAYDSSHIAMTYTGLACLLILGDDLRLVNKYACLQGIKALQLPDGSFKSTYDGSENDMRFIYCACCVCSILDDFSAIDQNAATSFMLKALSYDGAFGQGQDQESHGGSTFCACASLHLMGRLHKTLSKKKMKRLLHWCVNRQCKGFHGRAHKDDDTCYSFWIGASLRLLGQYDLVEFKENESFILSTQDVIVGGFGKWPQMHPDALHSYMGICGLALMGLYNLDPIEPALNITLRAKTHMDSVHEKWRELHKQKQLVTERSRQRTKSGSTIDRTHTGTVVLAFVLGLGTIIVPWIYKTYTGAS
ncbi:geranylgeranyl transferase type-1 subunit beta-like [Clavelina lepadiformis]|uniref:geranylgeranyl transferase type-1 subunit beta-like n=1 Tax=Clavelina lepadiformis TaxID=159417 RepID=UPI00404348F9